MSNDPEIQAGEHTPERPERRASLDRRRLLKAAAASAPFIATLPNGAAFANASAADCVVNDKKLSDDGLVQEVDKPSVPDGGPDDTFVRFSAWQRNAGCGGDTYYYVYAGDAEGWYDQDGNAVSTLPPGCGRNLPPGHPSSGDIKVYVLTHWIPEDDYNGVHPNAFYPVTKLDDSDPGNMGITATCLCSVDPDYVGETWCKP